MNEAMLERVIGNARKPGELPRFALVPAGELVQPS